MSDFDFINFLMIHDTDKGGKNTERRMDLQERASSIARRSGAEPLSLYEFKQEHPQEQPGTWRNLGLGAAIGGAAGAALGAVFSGGVLPLLAATAWGLSGAFTGGAIGAFADTKNTRRNDLLDQYEHYLDAFETTAKHHAPIMAKDVLVVRDDHAQTLQRGAAITAHR